MIKKLFVFMLAGALGLSITACGENEVKSVLEDSSAESSAVSEEEIELVIPEAVVNISEEDDKALTGVLTEDSYTNEYFGLKMNNLEGGTITCLLGDGDLFSQTYADGTDGILISSRSEDIGTVSLSVSAITEKQLGMSEEEMAQERYDFEQGFNESLGIDYECSVEQVSVAGEEHAAYVEISEEEGKKEKSAVIAIIKNEFVCKISIYGPVEKFDELLKCIEKI